MLRVTGICAGNSTETGEFPAQMASNAEAVSIRWRHHGIDLLNQWLMPDIAIQEYALIFLLASSELIYVRHMVLFPIPVTNSLWFSDSTLQYISGTTLAWVPVCFLNLSQINVD